MDVTWLQYAEAGWLEPLDPWFDTADVDALIKGARLGNSYKNHLYRWPWWQMWECCTGAQT